MTDEPTDQVSPTAAIIEGFLARRNELEDAGVRAEQLRTLPPDAVEILRDLGVFWLKTPADLGGTPLTPVEFCDVIEELAYIDVSAAWTAMIGNGCTGMAAGWLGEEGARQVFPPGAPLPIVAGQPQPRGKARAVPGGYVVSGRFTFSSGIVHANWVMGGFRPADGDGPFRVFLAPKNQARVIDTWYVAGLEGTGSLDFTVDDLFVPDELTYDPAGPSPRPEALYHQEIHTFVSNEVPPLCIGLARRALDDMTELAGHTARFAGAATLSERQVFRKELGRAEAKVRAASLLHRDAIRRSWDDAVSGRAPTAVRNIDVAVASVYAVETVAEVVSDLFRYGGGRVLSLGHPLQRHLRNALAARQHVAVTEQHYETAGGERIQSWKSREESAGGPSFPVPKAQPGSQLKRPEAETVSESHLERNNP